MRQSMAKLSKMPENLRKYQHGKSAHQTHKPIQKDVISSGRERLRCWFVSRKYRALKSHAFGVRHTQFNPCTRSNLVSRKYVTLSRYLIYWNVIRDTYFLNFVFQLEVFVVWLSTSSKLRFRPGAFSLMSLMELRTDHSLLKIVCDN